MAKYIIEVDGKPGYCAKGACGVAFANGKGETDSDRAAQWFEEHDGYTVSKSAAKKTAKPAEKAAKPAEKAAE